MFDLFTPRGITKFATRMIIRTAVESATSTALYAATDTDPNEDNTPIEVSSAVVGLMASWKIGPYTDAMIERVADARVTRKENKIIIEDTTE